MTDMTMGQRIAECRKKQSLSQEALGEKIGVSRQAISKWEADGAVPEIDKLIALSRLFGVSIGWLLGIEEAPAKEQSEEISEELLHKIEQIVLRYQPKKKSVSLGKKLLIGLAAALVCWAGWTFAREWDITRTEVGYVSGQVRNNNQQNATILDQLSQLEERINNMSVLPGAAVSAAILSDYDFQVSLSTDQATAQVGISAVPAKWTAELEASVSVRRAGQQILNQPCQWDGSAYTAQLTLEVEDGYEYWFVLAHPDGALEQTVLQNSQAERLAACFTIEISVAEGTAKFDLQNRQMRLINYSIYLAPPVMAMNSGVTLGTCELVLYHNWDSGLQAADAYILWEEEKDTAGSAGQPTEILSGVQLYPDASFSLPELEEGDGLEVWLIARLTNGVEKKRMIGSWGYINGEFIAGVSVKE